MFDLLFDRLGELLEAPAIGSGLAVAGGLVLALLLLVLPARRRSRAS